MTANAGAPNDVSETGTKIAERPKLTITTLVCPKCGDSYFADAYGALMLADHEVYFHGRKPGELGKLVPEELRRAFVSAFAYEPFTRALRVVQTGAGPKVLETAL